MYIVAHAVRLQEGSWRRSARYYLMFKSSGISSCISATWAESCDPARTKARLQNLAHMGRATPISIYRRCTQHTRTMRWVKSLSISSRSNTCPRVQHRLPLSAYFSREISVTLSANNRKHLVNKAWDSCQGSRLLHLAPEVSSNFM